MLDNIQTLGRLQPPSHSASDTKDSESDLTPKGATPYLIFGAASPDIAFESVPDAETKISPVAASWGLKVSALLCVIFLSMGSNFCSSSLSPLKSTIKAKIPAVTNARYGAISSSSDLINGILPIISGLVIDYYGPTIASLCCSIIILIGAIMTAVGGQRGSFGILLAGEIVQGLGSVSIETAQSKLYTHWFRGTKEAGASKALMAFVFGLDIAMGRVFNLMGNLSAVPVYHATGKWYWSFWLGAIMCAITLGINLLYVILERRLPKEERVKTGKQLAAEHLGSARGIEKANVDSTAGIATYGSQYFRNFTLSFWSIPAAFWLVTLSQLLQSGIVSAYSSNLSEAIQLTRGSTILVAGYTSALGQVIPIVLTPLWGLFFDRCGHRMHLVSATASLWILVFALLAYSDVHPLCPVILGSVALASNALPFIAAIPLLVPEQASIGTAFGIWKAFNNNGSTIVDVSVGAIQDGNPGGGYSRVFAFLIAFKAIDIFYGLGYDFFDRKYLGSVLRLSERSRIQQERCSIKGDEMSESRRLHRPIRWATIAGIFVALALVVTAYTVYMVYTFTA